MAGSVIVFGPTGNIASVAARTAQEHGAKVYLAMRNVQKDIPGLSSAQEKEGGFERVEADLTKPDTVAAAVKTTGAKRAFMYLAWGTSDGMKATLEALKSAGIELVVFLSSYTVQGDPKKIQPSEVIPYAHAQIEISLEEVFGPNDYVAVRPGAFATNTFQWASGAKSGELKLWGADTPFDYITPGDMGRVSGTILAKGPQDGQKIVYLHGPQFIPQKDAVGIISKVIGKDIKIKPMTEEEAYEHYKASGMPEPVVKYIMKIFSAIENGDDVRAGIFKYHDEGVKNVSKYSGRAAEGFQEWVEANKGQFGA